jgi:hypothetical protein
MDRETHPYFVPDNTFGSRRETATALVGTASSFDIPQREVFAVPSGGGFRVSENIYKALGWADDEDSPEQPGISETRTDPGQTVTGSVPDSEGVLTGQVPVAPVVITDNGFEGTEPDETQYQDGDLSSAEDEDDLDDLDDEEPVETAEQVDDAALADEDDLDDEEVAPYSEWDYTDLKAEVAKRGLEVENQRGPTLVAALEADDAQAEQAEQS